MILAVVQARLSSTRLPGKVLRPILGRPLLQLQLERLNQSRSLDQIIVATSDQPSDRPLVQSCRDFGVDCICGSLDDVLDRYYQAARHCGAHQIVRVTGDCPLIDPVVIDQVIAQHVSGDYDYTSNVHPPTFPDGLDVEVMRFSCLEQTWRQAKLPSDREHVTPFIWRQPELFALSNVTNETDLSNLRWTVDEAEDFEFVSRVYQALYLTDPSFSTTQVLAFVAAHPELSELNKQFERNAGMRRSIALDPA